MEEKNIIIYNTQDGKSSVSLLTKEGTVWMNQNQLAELFATSVPNISMHISNILKDKELDEGKPDALDLECNIHLNSEYEYDMIEIVESIAYQVDCYTVSIKIMKQFQQPIHKLTFYKK